jgi:hypothetical protein
MKVCALFSGNKKQETGLSNFLFLVISLIALSSAIRMMLSAICGTLPAK